MRVTIGTALFILSIKIMGMDHAGKMFAKAITNLRKQGYTVIIKED